MRKVSLQQIADELNVSRITVSKVINNKEGVSDDTRRRVARKLVEYDYKKINRDILRLAQEAETGSAIVRNNIAVIATEPDFSDYWLKIINGIANEVSSRGYNFVYHFLTRNEETNFSIPKSVVDHSVCGIIVINVYNNAAITALSNSGIPAVFLDITPQKYRDGVNGDIVLLEGKRTIEQITESIIRRGRRSLGFVGDITYAKTMLDRYKGFEEACAEFGIWIDPKYCLTTSKRGHFYFQDEVREYIRNLSSFPEAFICANDVIAYTVISGLNERGCHVPEDVAVSGYDNIKASILTASELTTASIETADLGKRLAQQLLRMLESPGNSREIVLIQPRIIYKRSTEF
ncbi:MAG: LacI family DNA-binding transcriptional regulator [Candidatus Merdivicinus sp.]|jgi:LacI family transcriptional regulator